MNIAGVDYNLNHKALEIYVSGCDLRCEGCHNKELWDFNGGRPYFGHWDKIIHKKLKESMVENVWVMGGEPLNQKTIFLYEFLWGLFFIGKPIWLWTGYREDQIPKYINSVCDYIKCGAYDTTKPSYIEPMFSMELASNNQKIIKVKK